MDSDRKGQVVKRFYILGIINVIVSVAALLIGAFAVSTSDSKFPYNAGGAIIGGSFAIFLSCCPCYVHSKYSNNEGTDFGCSLICMVIWFSLAILALPIGLALGGVYGLVECSKPNGGKYCDTQTDAKVALCVLTLIVTLVLMVLDLCIFFTCCCNSATLGLPLMAGYSGDYGSSNIQARYIWQEMQEERQRERARLEARGPVNRPDTVFTVDSAGIVEPSAPISGGESNPAEPVDAEGQEDGLPSYESARAQLDDPPPSYEEVMRTT